MLGFGKKADPQFDARVAQVNGEHDVITPADYTDVTTMDQVENGIARGELEWFVLIPEEFGGDTSATGRVPAPAGTTAHLQPLYDLLADMLRAGVQVGLQLNVGYVADSLVAGAVIVSAPRKDRGASVDTVFPLWAPPA